MDHQQWQDVIDTNLGGCFNMAKAVFDGMTGRKYGRIVNIGSINGQAGQYGQVNYAAAKSGIHGFTKALAQEGARAGVTVNAIAPGYIDTDMVAAVPEEVLGKIVARIPVGRLGKAEEIARAVGFLVDENAGFITGSTLSINGGQHMYLMERRSNHDPALRAKAPRNDDLRYADQTLGADRRASDVDQPRADVLARTRRRGARAGLSVERAGRGNRRRAARRRSSRRT